MSAARKVPTYTDTWRELHRLPPGAVMVVSQSFIKRHGDELPSNVTYSFAANRAILYNKEPKK